MGARVNISLFISSCLRLSPENRTLQYSLLLDLKKEKEKRIKQVFKTAQQSKDLYSLHTALTLFGPVALSAASLALLEQHWYPQTCKKTFSTWHVIWRSRCRLTKAAHACIETKAPKWHIATQHAVHQSRKYLTRLCWCVCVFVWESVNVPDNDRAVSNQEMPLQ